MKKNNLIVFEEPISGVNSLTLTRDKFIEERERVTTKVEFIGVDNKPITTHQEFLKSFQEIKAKISFTFHKKNPQTKLNKGDVKYRLNNTKQKKAYLLCKWKAIKKYLNDNFVTPLNKEWVIPYEIPSSPTITSMKCVLGVHPSGEADKLMVVARNEHYVGAERDAHLRLEPEYSFYFETGECIESDEVVKFESPTNKTPSAEKPFLTWTKVIVFLLVIGVITLLYFYRKKIEGWIKREDKSKKKEQVEIF